LERFRWLFSKGPSLDILAGVVFDFSGRHRPKTREACRYHLLLLKRALREEGKPCGSHEALTAELYKCGQGNDGSALRSRRKERGGVLVKAISKTPVCTYLTLQRDVYLNWLVACRLCHNQVNYHCSRVLNRRKEMHMTKTASCEANSTCTDWGLLIRRQNDVMRFMK
jgi:hypothetical protein